MSAKQIGPVLKAWYQWKSLRLPWRKRFLVGLDLQGNTYWEFRIRGVDAPPPGADPSSRHHRFRRIVQYPRSTHYSEVKVPPQWHQWLRYRRDDAPTLRDQFADVARRERVRTLAAEADARWAAKPSLLDMPVAPRSERQSAPAPIPVLDAEGTWPGERGQAAREREDEEDQGRRQRKDPAPAQADSSPQPREDPWKRPQGGPSETWQPAAWVPSATARKR